MNNLSLDFALVGHNFYTFLLSIGLLEKGRNVLILDDNRFNYGDFFTGSLTRLDIEYLKEWGVKSNLAILRNIEDYIEPSRIAFNIGKKQVYLGDSPHCNTRELCRKFPELFLNTEMDMSLFSNEERMSRYDETFNEFCQKFAIIIYNEKKSSKLSEIFELNLPEEIKGQFKHFFALFNKKTELPEETLYELNALTYMMRGFFQNKLSISGTKAELLLTFFSMLSPYYRLNHEKLTNDLLTHHKSLGGEFKQLNLQDLKSQKGLVKSFELESFDGVIKPKKMAFIGGYPVGMPIKLSPLNTLSYQCINVSVRVKEVPKLLQGKKLLFTSPMKIGTSRPFWEANFKDNNIVFNLVLSIRDGVKIEFIQEKTLDLLLSDLKYIYPEFNFEFSDVEMKFTLDVFNEDKNFNAHKKSDFLFKRRITQVIEHTKPFIVSRLRNVYYFGPYNECHLGTFSSLVELKKWRETL